MATEVNEGSTAQLAITFLDFDGDPAAPTAATWEAHDVRTGEELQAATAIRPVATEVEIVIPYAVQAILSGDSREKRRITVRATYPNGGAHNAQFEYDVINLSQVS